MSLPYHRFLIFLLSVVSVSAQAQRNLAKGCTYQLNPAPNYSYCTDDGDLTQLTDGRVNSGRFWTKKSTVGWAHKEYCEISVDLGQTHSIGGFSYRATAGLANVDWPAALYIFSSDDGEAWYLVGDLVAKGENPPASNAEDHEFKSNQMETAGRYIKFVSITKGCCSFVDEIEVFEKKGAVRAQSKAIRDVSALLPRFKIHALKLAQYRLDLAEIGKDIETLPEASPAKANLRREFTGFRDKVDQQSPLAPWPFFEATFPMDGLHEKIFTFQARVWQAQKKPNLRLWKTHRWAPLAPGAEPSTPSDPVGLEVHAAKGEVRSDVFNLSSAFAQRCPATVQVVGLPPELIAGLELEEVLHTGSRHGASIASALLPLRRIRSDRFEMLLQPGLTQQIWCRVRTGTTAPGAYTGSLRIKPDLGSELIVPIRITLHEVDPGPQIVQVGGWEYSNRPFYDLNNDTIPQAIGLLKDAGINCAWATKSAMPRGTYKGIEFDTHPDTAEFDAWVAKWPDAAHYMVYLGISKSTIVDARYVGSNPKTKGFELKLRAWTRFWSNHLQSLGIAPKRLAIHICDEPHTKEQFEALERWAAIIKSEEPSFVIWSDPRPTKQNTRYIDLLKSIDVLVPNRSEWHVGGSAYQRYFREQLKKGTQTGLFACRDPVRKFDPWIFFGLHFWRCHEQGATWAGFWAFSDSGRSSRMNEYEAHTRGPYSPLFIGEGRVLGSKYLEAMREGIQDQTLFRSVGLSHRDDGFAQQLKAERIGNLFWSGETDYSQFDALRRRAYEP